jgi:hypothetical protein
MTEKPVYPDDGVQDQIELRQRVEELEKIIIAMSSGAKFAISLDHNGRPQLSEVDYGNLPK